MQSATTSRADQISTVNPRPHEEIASTESPGLISVNLGDVDNQGRASFTVSAAEPITLRHVLPLLESLDIEALEERSDQSRSVGESHSHTYEFSVHAGEHAQPAMTSRNVTEPVLAAFHAMWAGLADADDYNALILAADLTWQQVAVLRAIGRFLGQSTLPYEQTRVQQVLLDHPGAAGALAAVFEARFGHPEVAADDHDRQARVVAARTELDRHVQQVVSLDADRILKAYTAFIDATVRTNAYREDTLTPARPWLAFKFRPGEIEILPAPRPHFEIFVYSPTVEGVHLRFGSVSRGGVRWSDRIDDYRTEVLGLVKAQAVKNAVIVPAGAKGVFVPKPAHSHAPGRRRSTAADGAAGLAGYRQFIGGLLDVTDNRGTDDGIHPPVSVVCYDEPDPYLVVAADKGTARFSDAANELALSRHFWLGDAFASGGSTGYDHKAMGITARGAWVSAQVHLREHGIDADRDEFTAVGIGDMSGDVFGNGMLLAPGLGLLGAFDHRHIFCDPTPDRQKAFTERARLFALAGSSWADYDPAALSAGGGVWPRSAKAIPLTPVLRSALGIADPVSAMTPEALIQAILRAPVDLMWNGGIGTYVKASDEQHLDVGDKVNDPVRIDAAQLRARTVVEGGNLGVSPRGRVEYARAGGSINSDAIDNAAGVDCSDHEVNIKILLDAVPQSFSADERAGLLASMTDDVASHVLANSRDHNRILSTARYEAQRMAHVHARMVEDLEARRGLNRELETLPTADEFANLTAAGIGISSPQLATLLAHVKLDFKDRLSRSDLFDDEYFTPILRAYFPTAVRDRFAPSIDQHPLRREILGTVLVNRILAVGGLTYLFRLSDETGATSADIARAYCVAAEVFAIPALMAAIEHAHLPVELSNELAVEARRLLDRASRWLLSNRPQPLSINVETARFGPVVAALSAQVGTLLQGSEAASVSEVVDAYVRRGVPEQLARAIGESLYCFSLLDVTEAHHVDPAEHTEVLAATYFALSAHLGVDDLLFAVSSLPRGDRWHALARLALREDLYRSLRSLTLDVARHASSEDTDALARIEVWESFNQSRLRRSRRSLLDLRQHAPHNLAALTVAATQIRRMTNSAN